MGWYDRTHIEVCVHTACVWEASSRKLGNVHPGAAFNNLNYFHFLLSAGVTAAYMGDAPCLSIGRTIRGAVRAVQVAIGTNSNLGIALLLAPLSSPWADFGPIEGGVNLGKEELDRNLRKLSVQDARFVYEAIRLANPGGLGDAPEQDVRDEPTVTLLEAMRLAAARDMVARQYANGFADVFDFGVPAFVDAFAKFGCVERAIIDSQLRWLATYPDSLIARKNGNAIAEDVRHRAAEVLALGGIATAEGRAAGVALDRHLRSDGNKLNPGTTADLITASLFVALRERKVKPSDPFSWNVPDWL